MEAIMHMQVMPRSDINPILPSSSWLPWTSPKGSSDFCIPTWIITREWKTLAVCAHRVQCQASRTLIAGEWAWIILLPTINRPATVGAVQWSPYIHRAIVALQCSATGCTPFVSYSSSLASSPYLGGVDYQQTRVHYIPLCCSETPLFTPCDNWWGGKAMTSDWDVCNYHQLKTSPPYIVHHCNTVWSGTNEFLHTNSALSKVFNFGPGLG